VRAQRLGSRSARRNSWLGRRGISSTRRETKAGDATVMSPWDVVSEQPDDALDRLLASMPPAGRPNYPARDASLIEQVSFRLWSVGFNSSRRKPIATMVGVFLIATLVSLSGWTIRSLPSAVRSGTKLDGSPVTGGWWTRENLRIFAVLGASFLSAVLTIGALPRDPRRDGLVTLTFVLLCAAAIGFCLRGRAIIQRWRGSPELPLSLLLVGAWAIYLITYDPWKYGPDWVPATLRRGWPIWRFGGALDAFQAGPLTVMVGVGVIVTAVCLTGWAVRAINTVVSFSISTRAYFLALATILTLSAAYYFAVALPTTGRARLEFEREKYEAEQKEKADLAEQTGKRSERILSTRLFRRSRGEVLVLR
jgi:hypothetical protein